MTIEDKELLLIDLSARLAYGVVCVGITYELDDDGERYIPFKVKDILTEIHNYKLETASVRLGLISSCKLETVKPYLRPMSSMTEEEENEWNGLNIDPLFEAVGGQHTRIEDLMLRAKSQYNPTDWLNAHHFDYRGLIEKGLAIEVTKDNNPYKE